MDVNLPNKALYLLTAFLLSLIPNVQGQLSECPLQCPDGWISFRGSCYFMSEGISVNWTEAIHHCETHRSNLVVIESQAEDFFIQSELDRMYRTPQQKAGECFWIGASDEVIERIWVWYLGDKPLTYTGWYPGQPENGSEDCAAILKRPPDTQAGFNGWHDVSCTGKCHPVCKISPNQPSVATDASLIG